MTFKQELLTTARQIIRDGGERMEEYGQDYNVTAMEFYERGGQV